MDEPTKIIAVVRGAANAEIQEIFRELADQWRPDVQLAGLVAESHGLPDRHCQAGYLRNLATGAWFSIFHDLGPGVTATSMGSAPLPPPQQCNAISRRAATSSC